MNTSTEFYVHQHALPVDNAELLHEVTSSEA